MFPCNRYLAVLMLGTTLSAQNAFPSTLPIQGRLTLPNGTVANGTFKITFRIYDAASIGTMLWTEVQNGVSVSKGVWKTELGGATGFPTSLWNGKPRWLGIQVASDTEMVPRISISAQAYSRLAQEAVDVKDRDIHPKTVTIGSRQIIDATGKWIGDPTGLKGPKGDTGAAGSRGPKGDAGLRGPKGDTGATGSRGPKGDTGPAGAQGPAGSANLNGNAGRMVRFTGPAKGGNSILLDSGTDLGIGALNPSTRFYMYIPMSDAKNQVGISVRSLGSNPGTHTGIEANITGTDSRTVGLDGSAQITIPSTEFVYGVRGNANHGTSGAAFGVEARAASTSGHAYALWALASRYGTGNSYSLYGQHQGNGTGRKYGCYMTGEQRNYFSGTLAIGVDTGTNTLTVRGTTPWLAEFNKNMATGSGLIRFSRKGNYVGGIFETGGTVTYGAFTGAHFANLDRIPEPGTIVTLSGQNRRLSKATAEPVYGATSSSAANQKNVLGTFSARIPADDGVDAYDLIHAVGNTDVWVVDDGQAIAAGDGLITAHVPGHAMRDNGDFEIANVFARAAETVDWSTVTETIDGVKRKRISVLLDSFVVNHKADKLETRVENLERRLAQLEAAQRTR